MHFQEPSFPPAAPAGASDTQHRWVLAQSGAKLSPPAPFPHFR